MTFTYDEAARLLHTGGIDLTTDVLKVLLVDLDSTVETEFTVATISGFTDLSEADGANYLRQVLANVVVAIDAAQRQIEITADVTQFTDLGANVSTLNNLGALIYVVRNSDNDADNIPFAFYDDGGFPQTPTGATIQITWDPEGFHRSDIITA